METINFYTIVLKQYHDEIVAKIQFTIKNELEESQLYSLQEITNMIRLWQMGELNGSFAIGTKLAENAIFTIVQEDSI